MTKKRVRSVPIYVWVRPDELEVIRERMAEAGIRNMSAYIRKMALGGYVLHVDLEPVKELVSLQRRCANNLNQAAIHANSYGGLYPDELKRLQKDYADLWEPLAAHSGKERFGKEVTAPDDLFSDLFAAADDYFGVSTPEKLHHRPR